MTQRDPRRGFATRPRDPDTWVRTPDPPTSSPKPEAYTARLTVDVTTELRGRIKVTAFQRGLTVADMLRALLGREYPANDDAVAGGQS